MIFISSPYTSPIQGGQQLRFEKARKFTHHLLKSGLVAFSPIVYCHDMALHFNLPKDAAFWLRFNYGMLRLSEALFVYTISGWKESKGVNLEIRMAQALGIEVSYFAEDFSFIGEEMR